MYAEEGRAFREGGRTGSWRRGPSFFCTFRVSSPLCLHGVQSRVKVKYCNYAKYIIYFELTAENVGETAGEKDEGPGENIEIAAKR